MRLSLNWLSRFIDLSNLSKEEIIDKIIAAGFEVEEIIQLGSGTNLVVGEVVECRDHPDSDHLKITKTAIKNKILNIVCGAKNCRKGIKVIVAQEGSVLPGGTIKNTEKRGVLSEGMLCSLLELGISKELLDINSTSHEGIEELPADFSLDEENILTKLGYEDTILDLSIYANRPDCLAMFSLAKEMSAILNRECILPSYEGASKIGKKSDVCVQLQTRSCPHYLAKQIGKVTIKDSPLWLKAHLRSQGIASINNVVDISNYVMLETGQPLHFFDAEALPGKTIRVIDDYQGEYTALDGNKYVAQTGDIMIACDQEILALAGIIGGDASKIKDNTRSILIESALFDRSTIRRSANRLGLQTEASMRFAKGLDPLAQMKAMDRAVQLLIEFADASDIYETIEAGEVNYEERYVSETLQHLNSLIGKEYKLEEVLDVLNRLSFNPVVNGDVITCRIPSYRSEDIRLREDIDEEIVRLTNFDDLQASLPNLTTTIGRLSPLQKMRRRIRDILCNRGFHETISYSLTDEKGVKQAISPVGEVISLASPLSDARKFLRTSLLNSMITSLLYNLNRGNENVHLFEISRLYAQEKNEERLAILMRGELNSSKMRKDSMEVDFYTLKGILLNLLMRLGFAEGRIKVEEDKNPSTFFHPYRSALVKLDNEVIALIGELHPAFAAEKKMGRVLYGEVFLEKILAQKTGSIKVNALSKYPSVSRDISIVVNSDITAEELIKMTKKVAGSLAVNVEIFDIYEGQNIGAGKKSVSLSITFESRDQTLRNEDILPICEKVISELNHYFGASLRG